MQIFRTGPSLKRRRDYQFITRTLLRRGAQVDSRYARRTTEKTMYTGEDWFHIAGTWDYWHCQINLRVDLCERLTPRMDHDLVSAVMRSITTV